MRAAAARVHALHRAAVVEVGRELLAIKNQVEHGQFLAWVERECRMNIRTAQRAMTAAEMIGKYDNLSYLPADGLIALATRDAKPVVDQIIGRINDGERPTASQIKEEIEAAKHEAETAAKEVRLSLEASKRLRVRQQKQKPRELELERECAEGQRLAALAREKLCQMLAECLGPRLTEFGALAEEAKEWGIF